MQNDTPETPAEGALEKAQQEAEKYRTYYQYEYTQQKRIDHEDREDHDLRLEMVLLVERLGDLITESAERLAMKRGGDGDPFEVDSAEAEIVWQLAEFVTMSMIDRDDEMYDYVPGRGQYSRRHAQFWFVVDDYDDPPKLFIREPRIPKPEPEADEEGDDSENVANWQQSDDSETPTVVGAPDDQPSDAPGLRLVS